MINLMSPLKNHLKSFIKCAIRIQPSEDLQQSTSKLLTSQARLLSEVNRKKGHIEDLSDAEFSIFSQWGEDGIIDWILSHLPDIPRTFIEFGVENYKESNTRLLVLNRNWRGLAIDGSDSNIDDIKAQDIYWRHDISAVHAFITSGNIQEVITQNGFAGDVGILSIDIDGNDYWVWEAIQCIRPCIVICEYNAVLGDQYSITIPYRDDFIRSRAHWSNLYFGASINALKELGLRKGYTFLGTNSNGMNAFFIRRDLLDRLSGKIRSVSTYPSHFRESRDQEGILTHVSGVCRRHLIQHMPIYDLSSKKLVLISDLDEIYSECWRLGSPSRSPFLKR